MTAPKHPWRRRQAVDANPPSPTNPWDLWLQRLTAVSQIGLCILAVVGLFYTVIPLYKSALLEEEIGRKTRQLEMIKSTLRRTYENLRDQELRLYLSALDDKCNPSGAMKNVHGTVISGPRFQWKDPIFVNSFSACAGAFGRDGLEDLSVADRDLFLAAITRTAQEVDVLRLKTADDIEHLPERAAINPALLVPLSPAARAYIDSIQKTEPEAVARSALANQVFATREQLLVEHQDRVRKLFAALRSLPWPSDVAEAD